MSETLMQGSNIVRTFSGVAPSYREDGTMLEVGSIAGYVARIARSGTGPALSWEVATQLVGGVFDYYFSVDDNGPNTYSVSFVAIDTEGRISAPSAVVVINVIAQVISPPNPPVVA